MKFTIYHKATPSGITETVVTASNLGIARARFKQLRGCLKIYKIKKEK